MTMLIQNQAGAQTHKGQGIASFVIGIGSVVTVIALIAMATLLHIKTGKLTRELNIIMGLGMLSVVFLDLIGLGLGVAGILDRASKKTLPALGLMLNIAMLALFAACVTAGLSMEGQSARIGLPKPPMNIYALDDRLLPAAIAAAQSGEDE